MSETQEDVGTRLKSVRSAVGLSQRRLAKRCGVANATISQIESGAVNPTVGMLKKILDGIPLSFSEFFTYEHAAPAEKIFYTAEDLVEIKNDNVSFRFVGGNLADKRIQLMKERYEPGARTGKHPLRHDGEECGIILSGRLRVSVNGKTRTLRAGEAYYFKSDQPHMFENKSSEPCELISACTPPTF